MSDVESVAISFNNSLIAVNLTVSPGSGSNVCSRKLHRKINRGFFFHGTNKLGEELKKKNPSILKNRRFTELRRQDSNLRPLGYEPNELPLLHSAM